MAAQLLNQNSANNNKQATLTDDTIREHLSSLKTLPVETVNALINGTYQGASLALAGLLITKGRYTIDVLAYCINKNPCITELDLSDNHLISEDLVPLLTIPHLRKLNLRRNYINDLGATTLATSKSIVELDLSYNMVSESGALALANNAVLADLNLEGCMIFDEGWKSIMKASKSKRLEERTMAPEIQCDKINEIVNSKREEQKQTILDKVAELKEYGEALISAKYVEKGVTIVILADRIAAKVEDYYHGKIDINNASKQLESIITEGKQAVGKDRKFSDILAHIVLALSGVGLLLMLANKFIAKAQTGMFFNQTPSQKILSKVATELNNAFQPR